MPNESDWYKCGQCGKMFPSPEQLAKHEREVHPEMEPERDEEQAEPRPTR